MASLAKLSDAHVLLLAVEHTSNGNLEALHTLIKQWPKVLSRTIAYRLVLSFYPVDSPDQTALVDFLNALNGGQAHSDDFSSINVNPLISSLSRDDAARQCRTLKLQSIPEHTPQDTDKGLASFVIEWARRLEALGGTLQPLTAFIEQFVTLSPDLQLWYETNLVPILRLQYDFYPDNEDCIQLRELEKMTVQEGVNSLLQCAKRTHNAADIARDLDRVVAPWVVGASHRKRRRVEGETDTSEQGQQPWEYVNDWLINEGVADFAVAARTFVEWEGPPEEQGVSGHVTSYARAGLAIIYGCAESSQDTLAMSWDVLSKAAKLGGAAMPNLSTSRPTVSLDEAFVRELQDLDLLPTSLPKRTNHFTQVTPSSTQLVGGVLATASFLTELGLASSFGEIARVSVFGSERRHKDELRRILQQIPRQTRKEIDWRSVRLDLLWCQSWSRTPMTDHNQTPAYLRQLSVKYVEMQILDALLNAAQYNIVKEVYIHSRPSPLATSDVEARVVASIYEAYDNASNGNRDRGGMKRANEILRAFRPDFAQSTAFADIDHLIRATHSLSFYHLTLQHGIPFRPVAIRVQKDPLTLLEKVLEQDPKAYTKLDDLLEIGRNLVRAHLPSRGSLAQELDPVELRASDAEKRITYHAIMAALTANDFDTAYAYITTRLPSSTESPMSNVADDISWRAAYAAGKFRPSVSPKSLTSQIDSLAQRMELLSRALMLAPSGEALSGILATWRRYEEEMEGLKSQAVEEERSFDAKADAALPGGFGLEDRDADRDETQRTMARRTWPASRAGPSYEEEAPMGLFDVARGAATALRKSAAFPLGAGGLKGLKIREVGQGSEGSVGESAASFADVEGGRTRKRDMVATMVTNNLVSGLGWVLGAQPQDRVDRVDQGDGSG
ncbi:hypothetical protein PV08_05393 [Exophiala spinifera]|uniref:Sec39 domain-containing protein n=1 Tax=Exophiala spinifera TaxID=91928 RepID=A0A0D1ZRC2_9EURO|nr:uncharacterized protein PV08_05393 [Exophiala spinifera]KIW15347.1 hypothetical protein PV08_05393 [Exophiala spinifera]